WEHYQGQWSASAFGFQDFKVGTGEDDYLDIIVDAGETLDVFLQWSDEWGHSANDYNVEIEDQDFRRLGLAGITVQSGSGNPFEIASWRNDTGSAAHVGVAIWKVGNAASRELELFVHGRNSDGIDLFDDDRTVADSIIGHAAVSSVISVGAINASDP